MAKRKSTRRSRRSHKGLRGLGCNDCGPALNGLGDFGGGETRPMFKYALYAALAYFAYTKVVKPAGGLGALFLPSDINANPSLNRPYPGMPFYPGR